jgi:TonB family protein
MEEASVEQSSGAEELDDAALLFAENMLFMPASNGKEGIASESGLPIRFKMFDAVRR